MSSAEPQAWLNVEGTDLQQGDIVSGCMVPRLPEPYDPAEEQELELPLDQYPRLIVVSQSCDLEHADRSFLVALCPAHTVEEFEQGNPKMAKSGKWGLIRRGQIEGLHLLPSAESASDSKTALVVDFREILTLPYSYVSRIASQNAARSRLSPPYREAFSQAFGRYFMRVALPFQVPTK